MKKLQNHLATISRWKASHRMPACMHARMHTETNGQSQNVMPLSPSMGWQEAYGVH